MKQKGQFILFTREEFAEWLSKQNITRKIKTIQNHHTWSPSYKHFNGYNHFERLEAIDNYHENVRGWEDSGQNLVTFPDGIIAICRPLNTTPAGIKNNNTGAICIEHFGNFDRNGDKMTDEHRKTIIFINAVLCDKFKLSIDTKAIVYHRWFDLDTGKRITSATTKGSFKTCPGEAFFGGNMIEDCEKNFIPLVKQEFQNRKNKTTKGSCKVDELVKWQVEMGERALDELAKDGLVSNADDWKKKLGEHVPNWLFFEMMRRIADKKIGDK